MNYPSRIVTIGEKDASVVKYLQNRLNELGCGPILVDGDFGKNTANAVKNFQGRYSDREGHPLVIDGEVGIQTWNSLFDVVDKPTVVLSPLVAAVLEVARKEIGVSETPPFSNGGPRVTEYLKSVGIEPGNAWCAAFAYWCFNQASSIVGLPNPVYRTAGCLEHWRNTKGVKILSADAIQKPSLVVPGAIFIMNFGGGKGHTGIVTAVKAGYIETIEGNSNKGLSRDGGSVCALLRKINSINAGFILYS